LAVVDQGHQKQKVNSTKNDKGGSRKMGKIKKFEQIEPFPQLQF